MAISSVGMGLRIFEKHFKLDGQKGLDSKFSSSSIDFKNYVKNINISFKSMGKENFNRNFLEGSSKNHRRSIFISKNVLKNDIITKDNISVIRPSNGMHPKFLKKVLGKKFKTNKKKGTPLKFSNIS